MQLYPNRLNRLPLEVPPAAKRMGLERWRSTTRPHDTLQHQETDSSKGSAGHGRPQLWPVQHATSAKKGRSNAQSMGDVQSRGSIDLVGCGFNIPVRRSVRLCEDFLLFGGCAPCAP